VIGSTEGYAAAWNWPIAAGNDFREDDIRLARNVCLLANEPRKFLFQDEYPIGRYILVKDIPCRVIGILAERGFTGGGGNADDRIIMPISTVNRKLLNERRYVRAIRMKFEDVHRMDAHTEAVREVLRREHRIAEGDEDDFRILSAQEVLKFLKMLTGSLVVFLGITAGVGMIVGGVVLANLFYLGIQERKQEIGIKRALGASQRAIYWQFLLEALITTGLGGVAGVVLGISVSKVLTRLDLFVTVISWKLFVIALCSALMVGLIFGVKPAREASQLDPILAIRS
jgi:putative ABC transport system permease protein